jgi:drug/metabolite transporter (DMT)-like permease
MLVAAGQLTASTLMLAPMVTLADPPWLHAPLSLAGWGAMIGIALFSTAFAYVIFFRVLATAGPTNLALVTFLSPVTAIVSGWLVLGETIAPAALAGLALIAAGLAAIDGRLPALLR